MKMHDGEVDIDAGLVGRLVAAQFPRLAGLPISAVRSTGTVNAIYRLGDHLCARLPRVQTWARDLDKEWRWLPKLAPRLSLRVPEPVVKGRPASRYPFSWAIYRWIDGQPYADELVGNEHQAATDLAQFVAELRPMPGQLRAGTQQPAQSGHRSRTSVTSYAGGRQPSELLSPRPINRCGPRAPCGCFWVKR